MSNEAILRDLWVKPIKEQLEAVGRSAIFGPPPPPPTDEERARWRVKDQWREKREAEAYALAPWLKDQLEAAESYY